MLAKAGIQPSRWNRESSKLTHYPLYSRVPAYLKKSKKSWR